MTAMAIPIYKMARKPVPQHVEHAPPSDPIMIEDIKLPIVNYEASTTSLPITPSYQHLTGSHSYTGSYYHLRKMSNGQVKTATSELADFLKSSRPEDYGSPAVNALVDDLPGSSHQKKRRFLRATPRDALEKVRTQSPVPFRPPHVTPKTTSKGSPYLQIQVNYGSDGNKSGQFFGDISENTVPVPKSEPVSVGFDRAGREGDMFSHTQPTQIFMNTSPPPWSPPVSNESAPGTVDAYHNSLQASPGQVHKPPRRTPVLPTLNTDFGGCQPTIVQVQHIPRTIHTPTRELEVSDRASMVSADTGLYYTTSAQQESPDSRRESGHTRSCSDDQVVCTVVQSDTGVHSNKNRNSQTKPMRKLAKPGPPPNRALPMLPELNDITALSGSHPYQVIQHVDSPLVPPPTEKSGSTTDDRKKREDRVKARKARDMKAMQQKKLQEAIRLLDASAEAQGRTSPSPSLTAPLLQPRRHSSHSLENNTTRTPDTRRKGSVPELHQNNRRKLPTHEAPTPPRSPSPTHNPTPSDCTDSKATIRGGRLVPPPVENLQALLEESLCRQVQLEDRLESMEHKYMILEQALITVLQRTSSHRGESNSIENLLADFRITHPCRGWSEVFPLERDLSQTEH